MNPAREIRLVIDRPLSGPWNMAVDEVLMRSVGGDHALSEKVDSASLPVLRFYRWDQPTLSLGYFQQFADRDGHLPSRSIPMVRRNSGGGAIVHDLELTYSFTIAEHWIAEDQWLSKSTELYSCMHDTLIEVLASFRVGAVKVQQLQRDLESNFLCFRRRAPNDVLIAGHKVCGSAQRKKFQAISQHGSVILNTTPMAPEIIGINNLIGSEIQVSELIDRWTRQISARFNARFLPSKLTEMEKKEAQQVQDVKFNALRWNQRR